MLKTFLAAADQVQGTMLGSEMSEEERARGVRYVAGLIRWELQRALVASDPNFPCFLQAKNHIEGKWAFENPDNFMHTATIDGDAQYIITGLRGTCADLVFEVMPSVPGDNATVKWGVSVLDDATLQVEVDGTFSIAVGGDPPVDGGNYLASGPDAKEVFVRHVFGSDDEVAGEMEIHRVTPPTGPPAGVDGLLALGAARLVSRAAFYAKMGQDLKDKLPVNSVPAPHSNDFTGGLPGQTNTVGRFELSDGEGLLVSIEPVPCRYHSIVISNEEWMHSFDFRNTHCSLNEARAHRSADGRYYYVISIDDPGVPNWYDTNGHSSGIMFFRWTGLSGEMPVQPRIEVVRTVDARKYLPDNEPIIDGAARNAAIATRRRMLDLRYFGR